MANDKAPPVYMAISGRLEPHPNYEGGWRGKLIDGRRIEMLPSRDRNGEAGMAVMIEVKDPRK